MMEQRILYFSEVIQCLRKNLMSCFLALSISFAVSLGLVVVLKERTFKAVATFKQAQNPDEERGALHAFLKSVQNVPEEATASGIMQSRSILARAARQVGLQASIYGFFDLDFPSETPAVFTLIPIDENTYEVVGHGRGSLGRRMELGYVSWTLMEMPTRSVRVVLTPMRTLFTQMQKRLKIQTNRIDSHLLNLTFKHRDRLFAIAFVDALMDKYKEYLEEQHEKVALAQIAYLQRRCDQLGREFEETLDAHVAYLESESKDQGYVGLAQEMEMLTEPKEAYLSKSHQLDLELKKWQTPKLEAKVDHPWKGGVDRKEQLLLKQSLLSGDMASAEEFAGIDLELAEALFDACANQRDQLVSELANVKKAIAKVDLDDFPISNLGKMLEDPVSQAIIAKAAELALQIADRENYAERELRAAKEALCMQREYLKEHLLKQKITLEDRCGLACEKLAKLRGAAFDLIQREKEGIELKLKEIASEMRKIPAKWRQESKLKVKKELTMQMMEGLSHLCESKVINHHFFHIESGPLDRADSPLKPSSRHVLLLSSIGGISGAFFFFLFRLLRAVSRGLPASRAYLMERGYSFIDGCERWEKLALYIQPNEVVALVGIFQPDDLKRILKARGISSVIEKMPASPFEWVKSAASVLLVCETEQEAIRSTFIADRFVIQLTEQRPEDLEVFPKTQTHYIG